MNFEQAWEKARDKTEILRKRRNNLYTFGATKLPYYFIAESAINPNDVLVRRGEVMADKPQIIVPGNELSFEGFDSLFESDEMNYDMENLRLFCRMVKFPQMNYKNAQTSLDVITGTPEEIAQKHLRMLDVDNDSRTAVITGPEDTAMLSILMYVGEMVASSMESNMNEMYEHLRAKNDRS